MFQWYKYCFCNFCTLEGRASRAQYWSFTILNIIIYAIFAVLSRFTDVSAPSDGPEASFMPQDPVLAIVFGSIYFIFSLAIILPAISVTVRRLHDRDHNGLWVIAQFIPILNFVVFIFLLLPSQPRPNRYGIRAPQSPNDCVPVVPYNPYGCYNDAASNFSTQNMNTNMSNQKKSLSESVLDSIQAEETPMADSQAGISQPKTTNSETHRPTRAEESSLVAKLKKMSQS